MNDYNNADIVVAHNMEFDFNIIKRMLNKIDIIIYPSRNGLYNVNINDNFVTYSTDRTDLDMYYEKVGLAYGSASGRQRTNRNSALERMLSVSPTGSPKRLNFKETSGLSVFVPFVLKVLSLAF